MDYRTYYNMGTITLHSATTLGLTFVNKAVLTSYDFHFPLSLLMVQMLFTVMMLHCLRWSCLTDLPGYTLTKGWMVLPASLCYAVAITASMISLQGLSIPTFGVVRQTSPLVTLVLTIIVLRKKCPSCITLAAVIVLVAGCVATALADSSLATNMWAFLAGGVGVISTGLYQVLVQGFAERKMASHELLLINSSNTIPVVSLLAFYLELEELRSYERWTDAGLFTLLLAMSVLGTLLNYLSFVCSTLNSALTLSLVLPVRSTLQNAIGFYTFGGIENAPLAAFGITVSALGGFMFGLGQYREYHSAARDDGTINNTKCYLLPVQSDPSANCSLHGALSRKSLPPV